MVSSEQKEQIKQALAEQAKDEAKEQGTDALKNLTGGTEAGSLVNSLLGKKDSTQTDSTKVDSTKTDVKKAVEDKAKEALKGLIKKKKNN